MTSFLRTAASPKTSPGPEGLLSELKSRLINRVMDAELTTHLGYDKHGKRKMPGGGARKGHSKAEKMGSFFELCIEFFKQALLAKIPSKRSHYTLTSSRR